MQEKANKTRSNRKHAKSSGLNLKDHLLKDVTTVDQQHLSIVERNRQNAQIILDLLKENLIERVNEKRHEIARDQA